jgi:large subunit ribosomal protein L10
VRKQEKAEVVQGIQEKVAKAQINILTDFKGLKVEDMTRLRRQLQESAGEITVVKNTLLRRAAADDSPINPLLSLFTGPNALTLGYEDPVAVTKVLIKFAQEKPALQIKGAALGGQILTFQDLEALSKLPAREVLLAQLLGVLQGVPRNLVTVLAAVIRNLLNVLVALKDQKAEAEPEAAAPKEAEAAPEAAPEKKAAKEAKAAKEPEAAAAAPEAEAKAEAPEKKAAKEAAPAEEAAAPEKAEAAPEKAEAATADKPAGGDES